MVLNIVTDGGFDFGLATDAGDQVMMAQLPADQLNQLRSSPFTDAIALLGGNDYFENDNTGRIVFGNAGNDTIIGGVGNDTIAAGRDDDRIQATAGDNILFGNLGSDTLTGGSGNDSLFGGQGNDAINGGAGNDLLSGDRGVDTLTGGGGANQFFLQSSNANRDLITDFQPGVDKLRVPNGVTIADLRLQASGASTNVSLNGGVIAELNNVSVASLTTDDFIGELGNISTPPPESDGPNPNFEEQVLALVNQERTKEGLQPLVLEPSLRDAARTHSRNMAQQDFFDHTGADGSRFTDRIRETGFSITGASAENIAAGSATPEAVVRQWMNSSGHRANILNPALTQLGVGHYFLANDTGNVNYNHYWTQKFHAGQPSIGEPEPPRVEPPVEVLPPLPAPPNQPGTPPLPEPPKQGKPEPPNSQEPEISIPGSGPASSPGTPPQPPGSQQPTMPIPGATPGSTPPVEPTPPQPPGSQQPTIPTPGATPGSPPPPPAAQPPGSQQPPAPTPGATPGSTPPLPPLFGSVAPVAPAPGAAPPGMTPPVP